jgi:hypothetical protein
MPKVINHVVSPYTHKGRTRYCARIVLQGPGAQARNGGSLVNKEGNGTVLQGCFTKRTAAVQKLKSEFPIGSTWTKRQVAPWNKLKK